MTKGFNSIGGIIISWNWDNRIDNIQVSSQRYNSAGTPLWNAAGVQASIAPGFRGGKDIISDGANGAIIAFTDSRNDPNGLNYDDFLNLNPVNEDVFAQRISATGTRLWGDNALPVCVAAGNQEKMEAEFGDVLFSMINYARFLNINPEDALERTNKKFIDRFQYLESKADEIGKPLLDMTLAEMDVFWNEAKRMQ